MKINIVTPFTIDKNIGKEYNRVINNLPDDEWVCICDGDILFLTSDFGNILEEYAQQNPDTLLTCYTNRIHHLSPQLLNHVLLKDDSSFESGITNIETHIKQAEYLKQDLYKTKMINKPISGFLMLFPKSLWLKYKFSEETKLLGCDSEWSARLLDAKVPIRLMMGLYVWHTYRLTKGLTHKEHLL